jgi:hypothetical protein
MIYNTAGASKTITEAGKRAKYRRVFVSSKY